MGVVYRAFDRENQVEVALKTLRKLDGTALYRFKKEFRSLTDLVHPNLVTLYELMSTGDDWFFTMELLEGVSLIEWVRPRPASTTRLIDKVNTPGAAPPPSTIAIPPTPSGDYVVADEQDEMTRPGKSWWVMERTLDLERLRDSFSQLVNAVQYLHEAGKLHRDIKPSNVIVGEDGRAVLLDFGLVTETAVADRTVEHQLLGTPKYMAPEQAMGTDATEASDWYAVGVMLYEALCGRPPFRGKASEILRQKSEPLRSRPRDTDNDLPADLDQLVVDLLQLDPKQRPDAQAIIRALGGRPSTRAIPLRPVGEPAATTGEQLVGRDDVLRTLQQAVEDSRARMRTISVFVHGTSGVGKSAVVHQFLDQLRNDDDAIVLEGRCYERESVPYKALDAMIDALSNWLSKQPQQLAARLLPPEITALVRLFPVLDRVPAVADRAGPLFTVADPQKARRLAFVGLRTLLKRMCEQRPTVLFIDDLQWGDLDSAGFLRDLLSSPESPALLFVATYRRDEAESSALVQALRTPNVIDADYHREVALEALTEGEARRLVRKLTEGATIPEATISAIVRESGGSPLFLCELALSSVDGEADEVRLDSLLRRRIEASSQEAQQLLQTIAVAGHPVTLKVALGAAAVRDNATALEVLLSGRLVRLRQQGGRRLVESYHDRIRETVTAGLDAEELREVHRALAQILEVQDHSDPLELLDHWLGAGDQTRAAHYAALAADMANRALAFDRAIHNYKLAMELQDPTTTERAALLMNLGEALKNGGRLLEAAETFLQAADLNSEEDALDLKRRAVEQYVRGGRFDRGMELAREVLADVGLSMPNSTRRALLSVAFSRVWLKLRGLRPASSPGDIDTLELRRMEVCFSLSGGLAVFEPTLGTAFQMRHLRMALRSGDANHVALAVAYEAGFRSVAGVRMRTTCERLFHQAEELAERAEHPHAAATARFTGGLAAYLTGQWQTAYERLTQAETMMNDIATGLTWERDVVVLFRMAVLLSLGEVGEIIRGVPAYLREANERGNTHFAISLRSWRSNIAWLAMDEADEAERQLDLAVEALPMSKANFHLPHYYRLLSRTQIALYRGDHETAWQLVDPGYRSLHRSLIKRIEFTRIECAFLRARVALARAAGDHRAEMLKVANAMARAIMKERAEWGVPIAKLIHSLVAATNGDRQSAHRLAREAAEMFAADKMELLHQVARWRQADMAANDEDGDLRASARDWLEQQGIAAPQRFVELFAPTTK